MNKIEINNLQKQSTKTIYKNNLICLMALFAFLCLENVQALIEPVSGYISKRNGGTFSDGVKKGIGGELGAGLGMLGVYFGLPALGLSGSKLGNLVNNFFDNMPEPRAMKVFYGSVLLGGVAGGYLGYKGMGYLMNQYRAYKQNKLFK
jgi:hypothetical protein